MNDDLERKILRELYEGVRSVNPLDNTISDSKIVRDTKNKLKTALRNSPQRCTCIRRTWGGPCEVCQASDEEMHYLRLFYIAVRGAKKNKMTPREIQEIIGNLSKHIPS